MTDGNAKGKRNERAVAALFRAAGFDARRTIQGRGGREAADLEGVPFRLEIKAGSRAYVRPLAALEQCERDAQLAGDTRPCLAVTRVDRAAWMVTARLHVLACVVARTVPSNAAPAAMRALPVTCSLDAFLAAVGGPSGLERNAPGPKGPTD